MRSMPSARPCVSSGKRGLGTISTTAARSPRLIRSVARRRLWKVWVSSRERKKPTTPPAPSVTKGAIHGATSIPVSASSTGSADDGAADDERAHDKFVRE